jgi:single-strand DNA-binding protein
MEYIITGSLCEVYNVRNITDRFRKRDFVIVVDDTQNMKGYTNEQFIKFQLEQSKVLEIDSFKIGDEITVTFDIRGNKTETGQYFTNLRAIRVEKADSFCSPAETPQPEGKEINMWAGKQKYDKKIPVSPSDTKLLDPHDDMGIPTLPF